MNAINKKGVLDFLYTAGFNGKTIELYARSEAAAKQVAVEYFKPKKKQMSLVWVHPTGDSHE